MYVESLWVPTSCLGQGVGGQGVSRSGGHNREREAESFAGARAAVVVRVGADLIKCSPSAPRPSSGTSCLPVAAVWSCALRLRPVRRGLTARGDR